MSREKKDIKKTSDIEDVEECTKEKNLQSSRGKNIDH